MTGNAHQLVFCNTRIWSDNPVEVDGRGLMYINHCRSYMVVNSCDADRFLARKVSRRYNSPGDVESCRFGQPYGPGRLKHRVITIRDGGYQKASIIIICPWYLEQVKRALWTSNALTPMARRIQVYQQWPDLRPNYENNVLIDFYAFFDDTLVHEVVHSSYRYHKY